MLWHPIPGDVSFTAQPNVTTGVTYPTGPNRIAGTVIGPAALASWGYQALVRLTPDQVNLLLDPTRTLAIRNVSTFDLDPANAPVRRLFRFGDDFSSQLRTQGAHLRNVAVTVIPPAGDPRSSTAARLRPWPILRLARRWASTSPRRRPARLPAIRRSPMLPTSPGCGLSTGRSSSVRPRRQD